MDAKISSTTWNDPDFDNFTPEMFLTLFWMKTNPDRNDCGAYRFSPARFQLETKGLDPEWHAKTRLALGDLMLCEGHWFLYVPFIGECLKLGAVIGKNGRVNRGAEALTKPFQGLPKPLREKLLEVYQEFEPIWVQEPYRQSFEAESESERRLYQEPLGKPLPRATQGGDQSSIAKRRSDQGECEGGEVNGAIVPGEDEVVAYAAAFMDLARGMGPIPEGYALKWLAWRSTPRAGPFPADWRADLRWRFAGDVLEGKTAPAPGIRSRRSEIENRLKTANPEERAALREELRKLQEGAAA
jgi:hypothetical protein